MPTALAILCSDLHLSHRPPPCRADDWYGVMARYLGQLRRIQKGHWNCPVVIAGDVFDRWDSPPELVNFAIKYLPENCYAIPGQHDLPHHRYEDVQRSAYWTLVEAGKLTHLSPGLTTTLQSGLAINAFPWGFRPAPCDSAKWFGHIRLAVCHRYLWTDGFGHPGAAEGDRVTHLGRDLAGYHAAAFGDNHRGFREHQATWVRDRNTERSADPWACHVFNCGAFIRRKADEIGYSPRVGLLWSNGDVTEVPLDCSADRFAATVPGGKPLTIDLDPSAVLESLARLGSSAVSFADALRRHIATVDGEGVREVLLGILEGLAK